jgi:peptidoglycan/LPS O-acetylase OafA/YrhL
VFADALRVAVIVFVVVHHAAQAYGPTGGAWPVHAHDQCPWLRPFYAVNAAFGLGVLFLLAGYFVPRSCDRKGPLRFLEERWARIGVPLLVFAIGVHLPVLYLFGSRPPLGALFRWLYQQGWQPLYAHLWFLGHLLLYSAAYAAWQASTRAERPSRAWSPPGHLAIFSFVLALSLVTWVVRVAYPVDKWVPLFWLVPAEPAHLPSYVTLFALGTAAYRGDWLRRIPARVGMTWLGVGLVASAGAYVVYGLGSWDDLIAPGGLDLRSLVFSAWESLLCVSMTVGLVVFFRETFHRENRPLAAMAKDSYAAYMLHLAIVVALQAAIAGLHLPPLVKLALVAVLGVALAFGVAHLSRKVPGVRVILGTG